MQKIILAAMLILSIGMQAQDTGAAAMNAANTGTTNSWDKWIFTGAGTLAVAGGLVSLFVTGANGSNVTVNPVATAATTH